MKVKDEREWASLKKAYQDRGGSEGAAIIRLAERVGQSLDQHTTLTRDLVNEAFDGGDTEKVHGGALLESLFILSQSWHRGDELVYSLSYIERRMWESVVMEKVAALARQAKMEEATK